MSNAADGYLGDWLPHKSTCKCSDCSVDRLRSELLAQRKLVEKLVEALKNLVEETVRSFGPSRYDTTLNKARAVLAEAKEQMQ